MQFPNDSTLQFVIENQAFTSSDVVNSIVYNYRAKEHYSGLWVRHGGDGKLQSDTENTLWEIRIDTFNFLPDVETKSVVKSNPTLMDFQLRAQTGNYSRAYFYGQMPGTSIPTDGYWETTFNESETSDWSDTITVNLNDKITLTPSQLASLNPTLSPGPSLTPTTTGSPTVTPTATPSSFQFDLSAGDKTYPVIAYSNSTITDLTFNSATKELNFKANGQTGTIGYCRITIPANLVWGELSIYKDETLLVENVDYTQSNDGTNNILEINYNHSTHNFKIIGTHAIPEFPWLMLLPLFLFVLSLAVLIRKRKISR